MFPFHSMVGIDIHAKEIRLLQLRRNKIEKIAANELPSGAIVDGKIKDVVSINQTIQKIVQQTYTQGCKAAIALPTLTTITKQIAMPGNLSEIECELTITLNWQRYFPEISGEPCFDFIIRKEDEFSNVLVVATQREILAEYINLFNQTGLNIAIVDVDQFALARAINFVYSQHDLITVLEINGEFAQLIILQHQFIIFQHKWVLKTMNDVCELNRMLQHYNDSHQNEKLTSLILVGDDLSSELKIMIEEICSLKIISANPFLKLAEKYENAQRWMLCLGLALRSVRKW